MTALQRNHGPFLRFGAGSLALQAAQMLAAVLTLRWLEPDQIGLWQALVIIQVYAQVVQGGVLAGLNRELPFSFGKGDHDDARALAATAQALSLGGALVVLLVAPFGSLFVRSSDGKICLWAIAIGAGAALYRQYLGGTYRAGGEFLRVARMRWIEAGLEFVSLWVVYFGGLKAYAGRYAVLALSGTILAHVWRPLRQLPRPTMSALRRLTLTGLPLFVSGYALSVAETFPRLALLEWGGTKTVGVFAPAMAASAVVQGVATIVAQYVYPLMSFRFGRNQNSSEIGAIAWKTFAGVFVAALPASILAIVLGPTLLEVFLPSYAESARALQWIGVGTLFVGIGPALNGLASIKAWRWLFVFAVAKMSVYWCMPRLGLRLGGTLGVFGASLAAADLCLAAIGLAIIWRASTRSGVPSERSHENRGEG